MEIREKARLAGILKDEGPEDKGPSLLPHLNYFVDHFFRLVRDRNYEQGTPLPLANWQIKEYFDMFGIYDFLGFHENIVKIDGVYLTVYNKESERKRKQEEQKSKTSSRSKNLPKRAPRR